MNVRKIKYIVACIVACVFFVGAGVAQADMQGIDVSNWQCGIDTANVNADFVVVGVTWGSGNVYNNCLRNGVNTDASRMLDDALRSGKSVGTYHYARGTNAISEADFYVDHVSNYVGRAVLAVDWEAQDNRAFGNGLWLEQFVRRVYDRTKVYPLVYVQASSIYQLTDYVRTNCGLWVAQYANMKSTGYQAKPWLIGRYGEAMRQYSSSGVIGGYAGRLDLNLFRGERWQWDKYVKGNRKVNSVLSPQKSTNKASTVTCVVVKRGDTLSGIAQRTGLLPWQAWTGYPSGNPNVLYVGNRVCYGGGEQTVQYRTHVVQAGESLWSIFGTDWYRVAKLNNLVNPNVIYVGQVIKY